MPETTNQHPADVYTKIAKAYATEFSQPTEHLDEFLKLIPAKGKILDTGCGVGVDAGYMDSRGFRVIGIDASSGMLAIAQNKFPQIEFNQVDIRQIDFPVGSFDGLVASFSLIHIQKKDIAAVLRTFHEILRSHGALYIALQSGQSEETFVVEPFKPDEKLFLNIMSFDEISELLEEAGFSVIQHYEREPRLDKELNFKKLFIIAKKLN